MSEEKLEEINTIAEFMEKLNKIKELERYKNLEKGDEIIDKFTIDLFYRGHSNNQYELVPSIERASRDVNYSVSTLEYTLISKAKNEYPTLFSETNNPLDLLFKLQHYGIPTRLLDITINPLVALYFVCKDKNNPINNDFDGEIFIFGNQFETIHYSALYHDIVKYIARTDIFSYKLIKITKFFLALLNNINISEQEIPKYIKDNNGELALIHAIYNLHFIYPPRLFERLYLQQGHFILPLNDYYYDEKTKIIELKPTLSPIPKDHKNIIARYIIPAESKKHLLEELKMLNITESTLFHDDVDRVCRNIVADFKWRYGK